MFDMNKALQQWRNDLTKAESCETADVDEMHSHLIDQIEALIASGLSQEESFWIATHRLGDNSCLQREFAKVNSSAIWSRRALWMITGILAFVTVSWLAGAFSSLCNITAMYADINGLFAGMLIAYMKIIFMASLLLLFYRSIRKPESCITKLDRMKPAARIVVLTIGMIVIYALSLGTRLLSNVIMARTNSAEEIGQMAMSSAAINIFVPLILPLILLLILLKLRAFSLKHTA